MSLVHSEYSILSPDARVATCLGFPFLSWGVDGGGQQVCDQFFFELFNFNATLPFEALNVLPSPCTQLVNLALHHSVGAFKPRAREATAAWQKVRNEFVDMWSDQIPGDVT